MTDINILRGISNLNGINIATVKNTEIGTKEKFKDILDDKLKINEKGNSDNKSNEIVFSKHANERIEQRNILVDEVVTNKLNEAAVQAKDKGLKNVLVMIDNQAFIISTMNNKVITAVNNNELKENIFTNIDGAVIK